MTTCSDAPRLAYGSILSSSSIYVNYTCNSGYSMQGNSFIECDNGVWNMTDYPICLVSLGEYTSDSMDYHADSNTTTEAAPEWSTWFVYGVMGSGGCLVLACVIACLLACAHVCGCCPGPVVAIGGRYQYSDRRWYSVFNWCDFMVKGKVCRKIRKMNRSKAVEVVNIDDESETEKPDEPETEKTDEPETEETDETEKDAKPPDDQGSVKQTKDNDNDISSSTSGYASSSPSASPLPEEEPLLPDGDNAENVKLSDIEENTSEVESQTVAENGAKKLCQSSPKTENKNNPAISSGSTKAETVKPKSKTPPKAGNDAVVIDIEKDDSKAYKKPKPQKKNTKTKKKK